MHEIPEVPEIPEPSPWEDLPFDDPNPMFPDTPEPEPSNTPEPED
jgi:hypothetical protein